MLSVLWHCSGASPRDGKWHHCGILQKALCFQAEATRSDFKLNIQDLTGIQCDSLFIIYSGPWTNAEISEIIGIDYIRPDWLTIQDNQARFILLRDNQVVYEETVDSGRYDLVEVCQRRLYDNSVNVHVYKQWHFGFISPWFYKFTVK